MNASTMGVIVLMNDTVQTTASTGSHIGPVLWQGIMMVLILPFGGLALWAFMKQPISPYTDEQWRQFRKYRRVYRASISSYILIGVILFFVLFRMGI